VVFLITIGGAVSLVDSTLAGEFGIFWKGEFNHVLRRSSLIV